MIRVVASITVKRGQRAAFVEIFKSNVPNVLAEDGCIGYEPMVDLDSGIAAQGGVRDNVVTIVEAWESLDHLHAHLQAPHMATYREKVKDMVESAALQILEPA